VLVERNGLSLTENPEKSKGKMGSTRALTDEEVRLISKSFGGRYWRRDKALFMLGCYTGFKITELLGLRVRDIWHDGTWAESVGVWKSTTKQRHYVPLRDEVKYSLNAWLVEFGLVEDAFLFKAQGKENRPIGRHQARRVLVSSYKTLDDNTPLFPSRQHGRSLSRSRSHCIIKEAFEANELSGKLATHSMRKTFVRILQDEGKTFQEIHELLGNFTPTCSGLYACSLDGLPAMGRGRVEANGHLGRKALALKWKNQKGRCVYCKKPMIPFDPQLMPTVDHRRSLARGGTHTDNNTVLAHLKCNSEKGPKGPEAFDMLL